MTDHTRRTVLKVTGASTLAVAAAGCLGGDDDDDNGDDGNGADDGDDAIEISPDERIVVEGITGGWEGIEPSQIEGEENPTLALEEGEEYEITWEQGDGSQHNVVLWDENEEVVEDYETPLTGDPDPDGDDLLTFEASDEIAYYRCAPHPNMQGEIEMQ